MYALLEIDIYESITIGVREFAFSLGLPNIFLGVLYAGIYLFDLSKELIFLFTCILHSIRARLTDLSSWLDLYIRRCIVVAAIFFIIFDNLDESLDVVDDIFAIFRDFKL
jgi:hypothetical protein